MNKSTHFSGYPIIQQVLKLLPVELISRTAKAYQADRYYNRKPTITPSPCSYAALSGVSSLRVINANAGLQEGINCTHNTS